MSLEVEALFILLLIKIGGSFITPYLDKTDNCRQDKLGINYRGTTNRTRSGKACEKWDSTSNNHSFKWLGDMNYCRNPNVSNVQPWCFTGNDSWEYCDIPICDCPAVTCKNNGSIVLKTCTCLCQEGFAGVFCETKLFKTKWPDGSYAVHATMFGCPEGEDHGWSVGYVNMTIIHSGVRKHSWNDNEAYTFEPHILGPFTRDSIQLNFCTMKSNVTIEKNEEQWQSGTYCVYRVGGFCPGGFEEGNVTIRGYSKEIGGVLPDLTIQKNSTDFTIHFCCREDGNTSSQLDLPEFPFILFLGPSEKKCQNVKGMEWKLEYFYLVAEVKFSYGGLVPSISAHPFLKNRAGIPFCFYKPFQRRECIYKTDSGASYNGRINVTGSHSRSCQLWSNYKDLTTNTRFVGEYEDTFCRAVYSGHSPVCPVNGRLYDCDIPYCEDDAADLLIFGEGRSYNSAPTKESSPASGAVDGLLGGVGLSMITNRPYSKPWLLVNLQEYIEVHAIVLHRQTVWFPRNNRFFGTYVSKHKWDFLTYGAYRCDYNRNPRTNKVFRYQCQRPIVGQYVSVKNFDLTDPDHRHGYYYYLEIAEIQIFGKLTYCGRQLGLIDGNVFDYQLEASTSKDANHLPKFGRLYWPSNSWCASYTDTNPWFMVDFIAQLKIQGLEIQGTNSGDRGMSSFSIMFGKEKHLLKSYEDPVGTNKIFRLDGSISSTSVQQFILNTEIYARYLKIIPLDYTEACLKLEVLGCPKQFSRDLFCKDPTFDYGLEGVKAHKFWMEESHDLERMIRPNVTSSDKCTDLCKSISCLSFTYSEEQETCSMHYGHKYNEDHDKWWTGGHEVSAVSYQRLCFKDISDLNKCGGNIQLNEKESKAIYSPGFSLLYPQGLNCTWSVESTKYVIIEIGTLELQSRTEITDLIGVYDVNIGLCEDTLTIEDSSGVSTKFLPTDNVSKGRKLISKSGKIDLKLSTCFHYGKTKRKAFEINVSVTDLPGCGTLDSCFQTCTEQSAYIITPGFPVSYKAGETCFWRIEGVYGQFVTLNIINIDIDGGDTCGQSFLAVYNIDRNDRSISLGKFCREKRTYQTIVSSWHKLHIEFRSSTEMPTAGGFYGKYNITSYIQETIQVHNLSCPADWYGFKNNCYTVRRRVKGLSWIEAEKECRKFNSSLVSITDTSEMKFIHNLITVLDSIDDERAYIGLQKKTNGYIMDDYIWSDGSPVTFTAWHHEEIDGTGQPDGLQNEKCSIIKLYSIHDLNNWHDVACAYDKIPNFICESLESKDAQLSDNRASISVLNVTDVKEAYQCVSGEYILRAFICDDVIDCLSKDDEYNCSKTCSEDQYTCEDGSCISIGLHCDFIDHCPDGSDEQLCERNKCASNEWQCANKQCIPIAKRCDFVPSCFDKSDEIDCVLCGPDSFQCYDATCIPYSRVCDGFVDCNGLFHEDEGDNCQYKIQSSCADRWRIGLQKSGEYLIGPTLNESSRVECSFEQINDSVHVSTVIHHNAEHLLIGSDNIIDVYPKYDANDNQINKLKDSNNCKQSIELYCYFTEREVIRESDSGKRVSSKTSRKNCRCPFVGNCDGNVTRCNCANEAYDWYTANYNEIRSDIGDLTTESEIPVKRLYAVEDSSVKKFVKLRLGPLVCTEDITASFSILRCRGGQTFPSTIRCVLEFDNKNEIIGCRDLSHLSHCETFICPTGYYKCQNSYCVPPNLLCNGVHDCPKRDDENSCDTPICDGLFRCQKSSKCINLHKRCDGNHDCPQHDDELMCDTSCPSYCQCNGYSSKCNVKQSLNETLSFPVSTRKIDLHASDLSSYEIDLSRNILLAEMNLSNTGIHDLNQIIFGNLQHNLYLLDLTYNLLSVIPKNAFQRLSHLKILLLYGNKMLNQIQSYSFSGLNSLPALEISQTNLQILRKLSFNGMMRLESLNLSSNKINTVEDRSFEGLDHLKSLDIRKNRISVFTKNIFNGLDNLEKIYSDAYVFCCLRPSSVTEDNCLPQKDEFSSCADMMRNDFLRVCLWVIGLSALTGNAIVIVYRIIFDRKSLSKGHGIFITSLGIADFTMGIYMLTIASADVIFRGNYVWNDLSWRYGSTCKFAGILSTFASECSVMFLFFITIDRFIAIKYPFGRIKFDKKRALITSSCIYLSCLVIAIVPTIPNNYFDGDFYSRSAVCLALPLTRDKPNGWQYSFGIFIILNFVIFLTIAIFQLVIYREVKATMHGVRSTKKKQDLTIARSLFLVVFSDFLCWFPVGVMGLMALNGHSIPGEVYALTAVFILPINSALNPFLYTFSAIVRTRKESIRRRSFNSNELKAKTSDRTTSISFVSNFSDIKTGDRLNEIIDKMLLENNLQTTDLDLVMARLTMARAELQNNSNELNMSEMR